MVFKRGFKRGMRRKYPARRKVRLPEPRQPTWKKLAGIGTTVANKLAMLPGYTGTIGKALSLVGNLINVESKFVDVTISETPSNTGSRTGLTFMAQGATDQTRNGNSILAKSMDIKLTLARNASATGTVMRVILLLDKQDGLGSAPAFSDVFQSVSLTSFVNMDKSDRFVILKNQILSLETGTGTIRELTWHQDLSHLHIKYDGTTGDQASATENHIYLFILTNEATNTPSVNGTSRLRFYDN